MSTSISVRERIARLESKTSPDAAARTASRSGPSSWGRKPVEVKPLELSSRPLKPAAVVVREVSVDKSKPNKLVQREVAEQMLAKTIRERDNGKVYTEWHAREIPSNEERKSDPDETLARVRRISEGGAKGLNSSAMGAGLRNHGQMIAAALNNARESESVCVLAVVLAVESRKRSNGCAVKGNLPKKKNSFKLLN